MHRNARLSWKFAQIPWKNCIYVFNVACLRGTARFRRDETRKANRNEIFIPAYFSSLISSGTRCSIGENELCLACGKGHFVLYCKSHTPLEDRNHSRTYCTIEGAKRNKISLVYLKYIVYIIYISTTAARAITPDFVYYYSGCMFPPGRGLTPSTHHYFYVTPSTPHYYHPRRSFSHCLTRIHSCTCE